MHHQFGENIARINGDHLVRIALFDDSSVGWIENLGDNRVVLIIFLHGTEGEDGLDDLCITTRFFFSAPHVIAVCQDDHRLALFDRDDVEISEGGRFAATCHDSGRGLLGQVQVEKVVHFLLVTVRENDDACIVFALIGHDEFPQDFNHSLFVPAQDQGVIFFNHLGVTAFEFIQLLIDGGGDESDQRGQHDHPHHAGRDCDDFVPRVGVQVLNHISWIRQFQEGDVGVPPEP